MKLVGSGPTGQILMALGPRPLRTQRLTERVTTCAPRTVYRHIRRLTELKLINRREDGGVPSKVVHSLSHDGGRELFRLLDAFAATTPPPGSPHRIDDRSWTCFALMGEMWASGWVEQLSHGPLSPTALTESTSGLTFHQVSLRTHQMKARKLLWESAMGGNGRLYHLTEQARQGMALVAGFGRWRQRHGGLGAGDTGLTTPELETVLRVALPLVEAPGHEGSSIKLGIVGAAGENRANDSRTLVGKVSRNGSIRWGEDVGIEADSWAVGTVGVWLAAILDRNRGRMRVGGDLHLVDRCLKQLYEVLWTRSYAE